MPHLQVKLAYRPLRNQLNQSRYHVRSGRHHQRDGGPVRHHVGADTAGSWRR